MQRTSWIVVGSDFSERAEHALAHALELAGHAGASIALVHAYDDAAGATEPELAARLAAAIARSGAAARGIHVEPVLRRGSVWDKLRNVATDLGATLIVIGSGGSVTARALTAGKRAALVIAMQEVV